jgi:uncharacterized protein YjbI with pentapeptide repeats
VFSGFSFSGANLSGANFTGVKISTDLAHCLLRGTNLTKANFSHGQLTGVNFNQATITSANFSNSVLSGISFSGKSLAGVNLSNATLTEVDLTGVDFQGATMFGLSAKHVWGVPIGLPKSWKVSGGRLARTFTKVGVLSVAGKFTKGSTLTALPGDWEPGTKFTYQWKRNGFAIPGATTQNYKLTVNDTGQNVSVTVTGLRPDCFDLSKTSTPRKSG